jgi:hypothetical protein
LPAQLMLPTVFWNLVLCTYTRPDYKLARVGIIIIIIKDFTSVAGHGRPLDVALFVMAL